MSSFSNSVPSLGGFDTQRPQQSISSAEVYAEAEEFSLTQCLLDHPDLVRGRVSSLCSC